MLSPTCFLSVLRTDLKYPRVVARSKLVEKIVSTMSSQAIRDAIAKYEGQIRSIRKSMCVAPSEATFVVQENRKKEAKVMKLRKKIGVMLCAMRACNTAQRSTTLPSMPSVSEASLSSQSTLQSVRAHNDRPKPRSRITTRKVRTPRSPLGMVCKKLISL
jgi:hypothetical protein